MKVVLIALALCAGAFAHADDIQIAQYGQTVYLPHCGGTATLVCQDTDNAKERDLCSIQFEGVSCQNVKMYVGRDFNPTSDTFEGQIQHSFYVDHTKISYGYVPFVNVFVNQSSGNNERYDKIQFQFGY